MPGMRDFVTETPSYRNVTVKTTTYTILLTDEKLQFAPTSVQVFTLPALNSLQGTTSHKKVYWISNTGTANATITPGTDTVTNVANTINGGKTTYSLKPNESIVVVGRETATDWLVTSPYPKPALDRVAFTWTVSSSGTTAVNIFGADGAPANLLITEILTNAQDSTAANITVYNSSSTMVTIAKSTVAGTIVGATTISYASVAAGSSFSVNGSADGTVKLTIIGTFQEYA